MTQMKTEPLDEIKTETQELCKDENLQKMTNQTDDITPLFQAGHILVIKPETQLDIPQPCRVENILVIKPENETENPEQCRDGYVSGIKTESEVGRSFDNVADGSTLDVKPESDVLFCDNVMDCSNRNGDLAIKSEDY